MKQRVGFALIRESLYRKLIKPNSILPRHYCTSSANVPPTPPPPKVPHSSKKGRLLTGATIGLLIAGGAYASTVDEATFWHEKNVTQYRAIFVVNCKIKSEQVVAQLGSKRKRGKKGRGSSEAEAGSDMGETYKHVCCSVCSTDVGVIDEEEVYHFFNVIPSES